MFNLINILICFFIFLITFQLILANSINIMEGLENQYNSYDTNNPANALILAQQNAGNISYLKERLDQNQTMYKEVQDLSGNVIDLQNQMDQLLQAQSDYANQMTGGTAPVITGTGTEDDEEDNEEDNVNVTG